jgi:MFS family permease
LALRIPSLDIFRHRAFARFWLGRVMVTLGGQIQFTAAGWQLYDAARSTGHSIAEAAFLLGLLGLAQFVPVLFLSLLGGSVVDRFDRKKILLICYVIKGAIAGALMFTPGLETAAMINVVFAGFIGVGAVNAFLPPANTALAPMLVPREELPQAIAWTSLGFQSSVIIGPTIGGLLFGYAPASPYVVTLTLFIVAFALLATTETPRQAPVENPRTTGMIMEGLRYVWSNKIVLGAISLDLIVVLLAGAVALPPVFARDILHAGPSEMGVLRSSMGAGAAIVALWLAVKPLRARVGLWMFGSTIVFGLATIVFGLSQYLWLTAAALAIAGGVDMISVYVRQSLIQLATPDAMRGRVAAVSFVFISASNELGDFEAGLMARILGPVLAVTAGGVAAVMASVWWMRLFPGLAKADGFEPVAEHREDAKPAAS